MNITPLDAWVCQKTDSASSRASRREIEAWQVQNINQTLAYVRARSPFYRELLAESPRSIDGLSDFQRFPFTTPEDIRRAPLRMVCVSQDDIQRVVSLQTSGTTGEMKRIFFTAGDQELTIDFFGVGMSTLTHPGERVLILLPGQTAGSVGDLLRLGLARTSREPLPYGPVRDPLHALETMRRMEPDCLVGSPTQVLGLARRWDAQHNTPPRTVLLSTDYAPRAIVRSLEAAWGCEVFDHYGATEMGLGGGVECEAHRGFHLREADLYFEIVDPDTGQPLPEGAYGEVVFTTLTRRGMPLIRYRTGDRSRFVPGDCPCGSALKTLEKIKGRFSGFLPTSGGALLRLPDLDEALFPIPGLLNFTVTLANPDGGRAALVVEAQMLYNEDGQALVETALRSIPALQDYPVIVRCRHDPTEAGSLHKRVIRKEQNQNA